MRILVFAACALSAACAKPPLVIRVPEYVAVPQQLLASYPCGQEIATNGDLLEAYATCVESVQKHEADKAAIRTLGDSPP